MKKYFYLLLFFLFVSCQKAPPEQYLKGLDLIRQKEYNSAIVSFLSIPKDETEYLDSGKSRICDIAKLMSINKEWSSLTNIVITNQISDSALISRMGDICIKELNRTLNKDNFREILYTTDTLLSGFIPRNKIMKFLIGVEELALKGIWITEISEGSLEIYFEKKDTIFEGISNKSIYGWDEGSVIYKKVRYIGNGQWDLQPKIWNYTLLGEITGTYYSKKLGSMRFINNNKIKIMYERELADGVNVVIFSRKEEPL